MRQQAPDRGVEGQAQARVRVLHPAAQFHAEPGLRVAPVMPQPDLYRWRQAPAVRPREGPRAFQDHPQPVRLGVRGGQAHDRLRGGAREHGIRARGELEAPGLRRRQQEAPAPDGPHDQRRVRLVVGGRLLLQGQLAPPVPQHAPYVQAVVDRIPQVGMEARQGVVQLAPASILQARHGVRALPPAVRDGHAGQPAVPFAIHPHGAREHVPVQGQGPVLAVELRGRHPAPGRQARAGAGVGTPQGQPEGTAQQHVTQPGELQVQGLGLPQPRVRGRPATPAASGLRAGAAGPRQVQPQSRGQARHQGGQRVRLRLGFFARRRGCLPPRQPVAAHGQMRGLPRRRAQPLPDRVRHVRRRRPPEPRQPRPLARGPSSRWCPWPGRRQSTPPTG